MCTAVVLLVLSLFCLDCAKCSCPATFTVSGSYCYKYPSVQLEWSNATEFCTQNGGSMAVISSADENTAFSDFRNTLPITGDPVWLGIHYVLANGGQWQFLMDYTGGQTVYTHFVNGTIPIGHDGDCVMGYSGNSDFIWQSVSCNVSLYFICEARFTVDATTTPTPALTFTNVSAFSNWIKFCVNCQSPALSNASLTVVRSVVQCAVLCTYSNLCVAFNYRTDNFRCQLVHQEFNTSAIFPLISWELWVDGGVIST